MTEDQAPSSERRKSQQARGPEEGAPESAHRDAAPTMPDGQDSATELSPAHLRQSIRASITEPSEVPASPEHPGRAASPESLSPLVDPSTAPPSEQPAERRAPRLLLIAAVAALVVGGATGGFVIDRMTRAPATPQAPSTSPPLPTSMEPDVAEAPKPAQPPEPPTLRERAERGETAAIDELERLPPTERTITDALAWARGRVASDQSDLDLLAQDIQKHPIDLEQKPDDPRLKGLRWYIEDRAMSVRALEIAASIDSPVGPDLLYDVWTRTPSRNDTTRLAEQLVYTPTVRARASEALSVVLDLRLAEGDCDATAEILPRAAEHGDIRAARLLRKLHGRRGCGPDGRSDCYPCLRGLGRTADSVSVTEAAARAKRRPAPLL